MSREEQSFTVNYKDGDKLKTFEGVVKAPTNKDKRESELQRAKTLARCTREGVRTAKEIREQNKEFYKEYDRQYHKLAHELAELEDRMKNPKGKKGQKPRLTDARQIAIDMRVKREEFRNLLASEGDIQDASAEALANDESFDYLVSACTFHKNGKPVYSSLEDYYSRAEDPISVRAANQLMALIYGINLDTMLQTQENQFLAKYKMIDAEGRLIDSKGRFVDADMNLVDEHGRRINEDGQLIDEKGNVYEEDPEVEFEDDFTIPEPEPQTEEEDSVVD